MKEKENGKIKHMQTRGQITKDGLQIICCLNHKCDTSRPLAITLILTKATQQRFLITIRIIQHEKNTLESYSNYSRPPQRTHRMTSSENF